MIEIWIVLCEKQTDKLTVNGFIFWLHGLKNNTDFLSTKCACNN